MRGKAQKTTSIACDVDLFAEVKERSDAAMTSVTQFTAFALRELLAKTTDAHEFKRLAYEAAVAALQRKLDYKP